MPDVGAFATGLAISATVGVAAGNPLIRLLRRIGARQTVSEDAPAGHRAKQGTPTMGGLIILAGIAAAACYALVANPNHVTHLGVLLLTLAYGGIGFLDDYLIVRRGKNLGLKARQKLGLQALVAVLFLVWIASTAIPGRSTVVGTLDLGPWYYVAAFLYLVGFANAVNFADGLDGLAAGLCLILAVVLALLVSVVGHLSWVMLFLGSVAGGCAAFLVFNRHPARIFMGDTGSLALGAALAGAAILGKAELLLALCAGVVWAELISVMLQVAVFQWRKRTHGLEYARAHRLFRRTPLHHHFEELGWGETRVVAVFWLSTLVLAAGALLIHRSADLVVY